VRGKYTHIAPCRAGPGDCAVGQESEGESGLSGVLKSQAEMVVGAYGEFFSNAKVAGEDGG